MIVVIIAGGSGTRLWPLSTPKYPKQLLRINGSKRSLLQSTYDRASKLSEKVYVIPDVSHAHHVKDQLPELKDDAFIVEPGRRGTASCIVAALAHISRIADLDEPIAFLASDHYVRDTTGFIHSFEVAASTSTTYDSIVLVGVEPDHPATGFGYIEKGDIVDSNGYVSSVKSFKEKPDFALAKQYVNSGNYLWNCSYFVASINTFLLEMKHSSPYLLECYKKLLECKNAKQYKETYLGFKNDAIDYALIERAKNLLVVPASFDWKDLGAFKDIHDAADKDELGNAVYGERVEIEDIENSYVQNLEDKLVVVIGLDNVIVVNTPNGILVARKDVSHKVGTIAKKIQAAK